MGKQAVNKGNMLADKEVLNPLVSPEVAEVVADVVVDTTPEVASEVVTADVKPVEIVGKGFHVMDKKMNIHAFAPNLELAEKIADEIGGTVKELK